MYSCECDTLELVRKAQLGDRDSLNRLAEAVRVRLHEYVYRLTLQEDLTQDIVQETILEMLRLFGKLRQTDRFWAWLQGIAFNKVRNHFGKQWRHKTRSLSEFDESTLPSHGDRDCDPNARRYSEDALADAVTDELKDIVLRCIEALEPRHRAILTMRCYDQMSYSDIGKLMDCSEIGARALFYRAKKALTSRLSRHGLGKGALLMALVIFGKMTAASKAAAAEITVTASTVSVGPTAALLATATSKTGLVTLAAIALVGVGSVGDWGSMIGGSSRRVNLPSEIPDPQSALAPDHRSERPPSDRWYYFPEGPRQAVMMRLVNFDESGKEPASMVLENQYANYHFDYRTNTVYVKNYRMWEEGLRVRRLPTDPPRLTAFLSQVEGDPVTASPAAGSTAGRFSNDRGMLIMCRREEGNERMVRQVDRHVNVLEEEYFQFGWPQSARRVDERDAIHRQGHAYFRVEGQLNGMTVSGAGCLPLAYKASFMHSPWIEIRIGQSLRLVDTREGAVIYNEDNRIVARYAGGSFFKGLARPWLGLHSIDTIRRDAAEQELRFQSRYDAQTGQATVVVQSEPAALTYRIDMTRDMLDRVELGSSRTAPAGVLTFTYSEDDGSTEAQFSEPRVGVSTTAKSNPQGMLWLFDILKTLEGTTP
jgi:RNA polymerase sigma factor (sigma-70 family)